MREEWPRSPRWHLVSGRVGSRWQHSIMIINASLLISYCYYRDTHRPDWHTTNLRNEANKPFIINGRHISLRRWRVRQTTHARHDWPPATTYYPLTEMITPPAQMNAPPIRMGSVGT
jgi:hypothetical protein